MYAKHPTDYFSSMIRASLEQDDKFYHIPEFIVVAYIYYKLVYLKQLVHWKVKRRIDNNETTDSSSSSSDGENSKAYLHALDSVMDLRKEINQIETRFELLLAYGKTSINYQNICPTDAISQARYLHSMLAMYRNRATRACGSQHALKMEHYTIEELDEAIKNDVIGVKLAPINALVQELEDQIHFMVNYESKKFEEQTREATTESSNEVNSAVKTDPAPIQMLIPRKKHKES